MCSCVQTHELLSHVAAHDSCCTHAHSSAAAVSTCCTKLLPSSCTLLHAGVPWSWALHISCERPCCAVVAAVSGCGALPPHTCMRCTTMEAGDECCCQLPTAASLLLHTAMGGCTVTVGTPPELCAVMSAVCTAVSSCIMLPLHVKHTAQQRAAVVASCTLQHASTAKLLATAVR